MQPWVFEPLQAATCNAKCWPIEQQLNSTSLIAAPSQVASTQVLQHFHKDACCQAIERTCQFMKCRCGIASSTCVWEESTSGFQCLLLTSKTQPTRPRSARRKGPQQLSWCQMVSFCCLEPHGQASYLHVKTLHSPVAPTRPQEINHRSCDSHGVYCCAQSCVRHTAIAQGTSYIVASMVSGLII